MSFNLEKFFQDIFNPQKGETISIVYDLPHSNIADNKEWKERREMAKEWREKLFQIADKWQVKVNPVITYKATGSSNSDLPQYGFMDDKEIVLAETIKKSSIFLIMSEFSATAPAKAIAKISGKIRGSTMPGVAKFMEQTSLSADYAKIQDKCRKIAPVFEDAVGAEVIFSTGHKCYFDISEKNPVHKSDGYLHKEVAGTIAAVCNLPTGEVYIVPNENKDSKTKGELPEKFGSELIVYKIEHNKIIEVLSDGPKSSEMREKFKKDNAWRNIAEVAIGCNDKATVCGNVLEDEKAGFHWAYGRSDHFGGKVGPKDFSAPENVIHYDVVYAKESPIQCSRLEFIFKDGTKKLLIKDGELLI